MTPLKFCSPLELGEAVPFMSKFNKGSIIAIKYVATVGREGMQ